jgi:hypothetical protein
VQSLVGYRGSLAWLVFLLRFHRVIINRDRWKGKGCLAASTKKCPAVIVDASGRVFRSIGRVMVWSLTADTLAGMILASVYSSVPRRMMEATVK